MAFQYVHFFHLKYNNNKLKQLDKVLGSKYEYRSWHRVLSLLDSYSFAKLYRIYPCTIFKNLVLQSYTIYPKNFQDVESL